MLVCSNQGSLNIDNTSEQAEHKVESELLRLSGVLALSPGVQDLNADLRTLPFPTQLSSPLGIFKYWIDDGVTS